jgi:RimJ/RimL family protein N-acetyltransferase
MVMALPDRLETARLQLRAPAEADAPLLFHAYTQDPAVARYMVWRPHASMTETVAFIAACRQSWTEGRSRAYVLTLRDDARQPIGMLEARLLGHKVDLGYVLSRRHWGAGLMPEAVRAVAEAALGRPDVFRVQATCDVDNLASARTLEKAGFAREGRLERCTVHPNISLDPRPCFLYARCR